MGDDVKGQLAAAAVGFARQAWQSGDIETALEFLEGMDPSNRPRDVEAGVCDAALKSASDRGAWSTAITYAERLVAASPGQELPARRLHALRARESPELTDDRFELMLEDPEPSRLPYDAIRPEVDAVVAVGTYIAWNTPSRLTELIRVAKKGTGQERDGATHLLGDLLSRFVMEWTDLLSIADLVTAVPSEPDRWLERDRWALPEALAKAMQSHAGVPFEPELLQRSRGRDVKMSELGRSARQRAVRGLYLPGNAASLARERCVLLLDDITTSGATLRACARELRQAGAAHVVAATIAHTEG